MKKKKMALLYLKTGGGHQSAARALSEEAARTGDVEPLLFDPLEDKQNFIREVIEGGFSILSSELKFFWPFIYEISYSEKSVKSIREISKRLFTNIIVKWLEKEKPYRIIILHYLLIAPVYQALGLTGFRCSSAVTIVLDPFSVHPVWYSDNPFPIYCFSEEAAETILSQNRKNESRVFKFPVIVSGRFSQKPWRLNRFPNTNIRRRILILGGGEGCSISLRFLKHLSIRRPDLMIDFICGKSKRLYERACRYVQKNNFSGNVIIHGFVNNIEDYIVVADLVLTKAGPASIMECLLIGRPLIIYDYLYGQEQGNVDFIERNNLGCFIDTPVLLEKRIDYFLNQDYRLRFNKKLQNLNLRSGTEEIVNSILSRDVG